MITGVCGFTWARIVQEVYKKFFTVLIKTCGQQYRYLYCDQYLKNGCPHVTPYDLYSLQVYYLYKYIDMQM